MNRFWALIDATARPEAAAVVRVVIGAAAVLKAVERAPVLDRLSDPAILRVPYVVGQPSIADLPPMLVLAVWVGLAAAFAAGAATRVTGSALTVLLLCVTFSDQQLYSNHLYLMAWLVGLLTLADAGAALSVDAMGRGGRLIAAAPLWLLRTQISVVYLFAGLSKVNAEYMSGSVLALNLRRDGVLAIPVEWRGFEVMATFALVSIIVEIGLAIALWLPRWRRTAFVMGLGLHVTLALWFEPPLQLIVFGMIMLAPYVLFLDLGPRPVTVVFDDSCGFCKHWIVWFRRFDWLRVLDVVPSSDGAELARLGVPRADADRALQLVGRRRRLEGFDAVIGILERLPISMLLAPLLRLWPILPIGRRAYARVAARRQCSINPDGPPVAGAGAE